MLLSFISPLLMRFMHHSGNFPLPSNSKLEAAFISLRLRRFTWQPQIVALSASGNSRTP